MTKMSNFKKPVFTVKMMIITLYFTLQVLHGDDQQYRFGSPPQESSVWHRHDVLLLNRLTKQEAALN
jgi:hypothetical protein